MTATNKNAPAATGASSSSRLAVHSCDKHTRPRSGDAITDPLERLVSRLDRVRRQGKGYTARCPAHEDRTASLSLSSGEDGRVLLHCFAGCSAADVVHACGLEIGDLFVRRDLRNLTPVERAVQREHASQARWRAALNAIQLEMGVIVIAGRQLLQGQPLDSTDLHRLGEAVDRVENAKAVLNAR
ncbi:CHC2 zinc finger domain-containing protein [Tahibacter harae]|uniref:CHC2 zinc finger domain-containing protein n=1 Tax=Tahibacter harae TaxID=2963937 RepID=A0ABT1QQZ9_9GAMM|nr:CHC2 zinc finger domain-containing protein [Tahibacter harae]MCQ4164697.1 CHC2 zinc finger domain-containing protein [Tahibacter harae]